MSGKRTGLLWLVVVGLTCALSGHAAERIRSYHSDIQIASDGSMQVTEHIQVIAEGERIVRGIYRDYPTDSRDSQRSHLHAAFEVLAAERDGYAEPWHQEEHESITRVFLGSADQVISAGEHTYTLRSRITQQIGFFQSHDQLDWNVTGFGWAFPVEHASAEIHLPKAVVSARLEANGVTGKKGDVSTDLQTTLLPDGARYVTTQPLQAHEGLTVVLSFPKGIVSESGHGKETWAVLQDHTNLMLALLGLALLWLYYGWVWYRYGRNPASAARVARYEPPAGESAAALRYVRQMGFDTTCVTVGILELAARGFLSIQHGKQRSYTLIAEPTPRDSRLPPDAAALYHALFPTGSVMVLGRSNEKTILHAQFAQNQALVLAYEKKYFSTNGNKLWYGRLITLIALLGLAENAPWTGWVALLCLSIWSFAAHDVVASLIRQRRESGKKNAPTGAGIGWPKISTLIVEVFFLGLFGYTTGAAAPLLFLALFGSNIAFSHWMKAATPIGAKLLDHIAGFRWYLGVARNQELDSRYRPETTPELFARYLPHAVALDMGNAWANRFAGALDAEQMSRAQPRWFSDSAVPVLESSNFANFNYDLSTRLTLAITSAAIAASSIPVSSSFDGNTDFSVSDTGDYGGGGDCGGSDGDGGGW